MRRSSGDNILERYQRIRIKFAAIVYILALLYVVFFLLVRLFLTDFLADILPFGGLVILVAFILVTLFVFIEKLRFLIGLNFIIAIVIVVLVAFGHYPEWNWICFAVAIILMMVLIIIGTLIPHDLTMDVVIFLVLAMIVFVYAALFTISLAAFNPTDHMDGLRVHILILAFLVACIIMIFVMYHAQTIYGMRYAEMRSKDYLLGSLILYHDFIILMYCIWAMYAIITYWGSDTELLKESTTTTTTTTTAKPA